MKLLEEVERAIAAAEGDCALSEAEAADLTERVRADARALWAYRVLVRDAAKRKSCRLLLVDMNSDPDGYEAQALREADRLVAADASLDPDAPRGALTKLCPAGAGPFDNVHVCALPYAHDGDCVFTRVRSGLK